MAQDFLPDGTPASPTPAEPAPPAAANPLHFADPADIDEFIEGLRRFERGEMSADDFRAFRLARGTYGQRQPDVNMLRVKIPQGILDGPQLEALASVADTYSRGFGHVTTRQNVQLHFVKLARAAEAMEELARVGLTTREACGNTVRNITGCALAGVCDGAPFDVTPYAQAATRHFLRNLAVGQALPRKFKIAFSGCAHDCAQGAINDVGLIAVTRTDAAGQTERGFRVRVAGGLSTSPENAHLLYEFLPTDELLPVLEAIVRLFDRTGNRQNRARARLKYVVRRLGFDGFRAEFEKELAALAAAGRARIPVDGEAPTQPAPPARETRPAGPPPSTRPGYLAWRASNVLAQRQAGYHAVVVRLVRGDITSAQLRALAPIAQAFGDGTVRLTNDQNVVLRFVAAADLPEVFVALDASELARAGARTIADVTACPGAETCNLAVTHSRELATALADRLEPGGALLAEAAAEGVKNLDIKISGCPNSCGQHHVAAIGFHGTMRRVGARQVPEYQLHLGGGIDADHGATFGRQVVKVPARRIPDAVVRLLELFHARRTPGEDALAFFRRVDEALVKEAVSDLARMDEATARPEDYVDLGQESQFVVAIGQGECAS